MWQAIADHIGAELQQDFQISHKQQLTTHSGNLLYQIQGQFADSATRDHHSQQRQFFVKLNQREVLDSFATEALSLQAISQRHCLRTPTVICTGQSLDKAFLVQDYLPLSNEHPYGWQALGHQLAFLHQADDQAMYGFDWDNYLSATLQPNQWQSNWSSFFSEQRIGWLLQLLAEQQQQFGNIDLIVERVRQQLHGHQPKPSLLHGELMRTNIGFLSEVPFVFDPACYFGDRETDLAFAGWLNPLPEAFFQAYQQVYPLPEGFLQRKDLYNLYHLLHHAYLHGGRYSWQAKEYIQQLLAS
jgi:fructosamine-3-kinase